jgi:hypothetical protein
MKKSNTNKNSITTVGVVIPVAWDHNGNPMIFALSTYEEQEYLINDKTEPGKKLIGMKKQKVRVTGTLGEVVNNRRVMTVNSYQQLPPSGDM